jgi:hypothetical protein
MWEREFLLWESQTKDCLQQSKRLRIDERIQINKIEIKLSEREEMQRLNCYTR